MSIPLSYVRTTSDAAISGGTGGLRIEMGCDPAVRVPNVITKSVGFIAEVTHEDSSGTSGDYLATGFFVCVPFQSPALAHKRFGYFVTAAHVAKELSDRPIYFAVNKRGGGLTGIEVLEKTWWVHPTDRSADVVVLSTLLNPEADMTCVAIKDFVTEEHFSSGKVGVGDEVFITGLFTEAPGVSQNMPLVRHGNIAMLPHEQIQTDMGFADVHLVEARSIGGLSGSPVFVRTSAASGDVGSIQGVKLLGLMQGHWDIRESEMNKASITHDRKRGVNMGISIVVPASKILETINSPSLVEWRMEAEKSILRERAPGSNIARKEKQGEEAFTKEAFESALKKASRKISPKK
jgi:hypothetical protein